MELNPAYDVVQQGFGENTYDNVDLQTDSTTDTDYKQPVTIVGGGTMPSKTGGKQRGVNVVLAIAIVAVLALAVIAIVVSVLLTSNSNQEITSLQLEIENLREALTANTQNLTQEVQDLQNTLQKEVNTLQKLIPKGTIENPASSCSNIPQDSPSGEYWIQTNNTNSPVQVYCDMNPRNCSCNTTGGWTRVANLDMTDPSQQCPDGFRRVNRTTAPLRTCGRPGPAECVSTTFPVHGIEYSQVCGRVIGYQFGAPDAFVTSATIDDTYVDGVSLTHGISPRQHIWTFAAALEELSSNHDVCPCTRPDLPYTGAVPPFVGQNYFCETGTRLRSPLIFYAYDPLWDGQGCRGNSTCCSFNNPPWFCKQLPQPTTDDIELRLCGDEYRMYRYDTPLEIVEMYIK